MGILADFKLSPKNEILNIGIEDGDERKVLIIIDDNNYLRSMRYEYYQLARKFEAGFCQLLFQSTLEMALVRNSSRDAKHRIPEEVIRRMSEKLEAPDPLKNSWE